MGIAIGNKIELVRLDQVIRNEQNKKVYVSKIYDILDQDKLQIAMPIFEGRIVPLDLDERYTACFYTERGLLQCNVQVTSRYKSGNLFFLDIKLLGALEKVQRRQFYRYDCLIDAQIRVVSDEEYDTGIPDDISVPEDGPRAAFCCDTPPFQVLRRDRSECRSHDPRRGSGSRPLPALRVPPTKCLRCSRSSHCRPPCGSRRCHSGSARR